MATVGTNCLNLRELSLRNFPFDNVLKQNCLLNFKNLERLDLLRSRIEIDLLLQVLKNNPNLKHLNISELIFGISEWLNITCYNRFSEPFSKHGYGCNATSNL